MTLPLHRVADDDVLAAGISKQLQDRAGLDFLEVQCQALAGVLRLLLLHVCSLTLRLHLDDILIVGLISELLVITRCVDGDTRTGANASHVKASYRRAEIGRVVAAHERGGQLGVGEVDDDLATELA